MEMEAGFVVEWRIENFSHWRAEMHGECIQSPQFCLDCCRNIELYPKGVGGTEERLTVRFRDNKLTLSGDLSFYRSDGTLLCKQPVSADGNTTPVLELTLGLRFEDVFSRTLGDYEDFITVRLRIEDPRHLEQRMCTTVNVSKTSLEINPRWIEELKPNETKSILYVQLSPNDFFKGLTLETRLNKNNAVDFVIAPQKRNDAPFAVEMCGSLTGSDVDTSRVEKEHVFRDNSPWTFLDSSLDKAEFVEKGMSLFLCLTITTSNSIHQSPSILNKDYRCVSIEPKNKVRRSTEIEPPVTSSKDSVATKDSGSQTSTATSDMPDDSVLSKDLMCLYQDQDFSDVQLRCDNVSFPVHRNILSARSPVFKTMLSTDMTEAASNEVDIGDLDPSTLGLFLTYLYTGEMEDLESDRALKLYYAADKYQVPSLVRECANFLIANMSLSNVCDTLSLADRHQDDRVTSAAHDFILKNFNEVLCSEEWDNLVKRDPLLVAKTVTQFAQKKYVKKSNAP